MIKDNELIIDGFAGGGGASVAIEMALGRSSDIAINHDAKALAMHMANHPYTKHYCQSIWDVSPRKATKGRKVGLAWFSPDCTHFSKAKGGKPLKKEIRSLAWVAVRWARDVRPRIIIIENVEEFKTWGKLLKNNKPCPIDKGRIFKRWVNELRGLGYNVEWRELKACDYGAPTIRKRLFVIARCDGMPIVWPKPTHGSGEDQPFRTAADCIDWSIPSLSIFASKAEAKAWAKQHKTGTPKRPLAENTMRRIARGVQRYVIDSPNPFIVQVAQTGGKGSGGVRAISDPLSTIVTKAEHCLISTFLAKHYTGVVGSEINKPTGTVTTIDHHSLVSCHIQRDFGQSIGSPASAPVGTITSNGGGKAALVTSNLVHLRRSTETHGNTAQDVRSPVRTITAGGTHIAEVKAFLVKYYGREGNPLLNDPLHTITTRDRFGLVQVSGEDYRIADICLRMLSPRELFLAQGFPASYKIDISDNGRKLSKSDQVRMVGNSVSPPCAAELIRANVLATKKAGPTTEQWTPGQVKPVQLSLFDLDDELMYA